MEIGEVVLYDSGYGYNVCIFYGDGDTYGTYSVMVLTGISQGLNCFPTHTIVTLDTFYEYVVLIYGVNKLSTIPQSKLDAAQYQSHLTMAVTQYNL